MRLEPFGDSIAYSLSDETFARVLVRNDQTGNLAVGETVRWEVVSGHGSMAVATSVTNRYGVAEAQVSTLGQTGDIRVRATHARQRGPAAVVDLRVVRRAEVTRVSPEPMVPGGTVTIEGTGFSSTPDHNTVLFGDVRGRVVSATTTQLEVEVPACLPHRSVAVTVRLGAAAGTGYLVAVAPSAHTASVTLQPGEATTVQGAAIGCISMPATPDALYLIVAHNTAAAHAPPLALGLWSATAQYTAAGVMASASAPFAAQWEAALRARERTLHQHFEPIAAGQSTAQPEVGDRRTFNVLNADNGFDEITAAIRLITRHAIFYVDVEAAGSLTDTDLQGFGTLFDDPIYETDVALFGQPSDIDGNGRVLILLTPKVNALTPRGSGSFIAGFFYGCDLVSRSRCSGTNRAEVFYALVPDPDGRWGDSRAASTVMNSVPTVIAHEFQHMINFARRNQTMESLWLSEGLAHTAEEAVAGVLASRGETVLAQRFNSGNLLNARRFLASPAAVDLLTEEAPGTLEARGAAWLFLRYLRGHYGGDDLLRRLTSSIRSGVANVVAETGQPWDRLRVDFGIALWADHAPELRGTTDPQHRFADYDLRAALGGVFPLRPAQRTWSDFSVGYTLTTGGHGYNLLRAPSTVPGLAMFIGDEHRRAPGPNAAISILRVQ